MKYIKTMQMFKQLVANNDVVITLFYDGAIAFEVLLKNLEPLTSSVFEIQSFKLRLLT